MELVKQDQIQIKGINLPQSIEKSLFKSLPMMLQMEISQEVIKKASAEVKLRLVDDVMRLLQVRNKNSDMAKDWLLFISTLNLKITPGEIYLAFKMALGREILDDKGNEIDLFPELSNNTTGKVISAYLKFKDSNQQYLLSKEKLKILKKSEKELTQKEIENIRENFLLKLFEDLLTNENSSDAWMLFSELEADGKISISVEEKRRIYTEQLRIYEVEEKAIIKTKYGILSEKHIKDLMIKIRGNDTLEVVSNRCRSLMVSKYLKQFNDFQSFKNAIKNG